MLPPDLRRTLAMTIDALHDARDPWWIIASAAVALHGVTPIVVGDVDVLTSVADAQRVMAMLGITAATGSGDAMFRSAVFGCWRVPPLTVEIMADFHVATADGWTRIAPRTREAVTVEGRVAFVPERAELTAMLRMFGRPKDFARARLLDRGTPANPDSSS